MIRSLGSLVMAKRWRTFVSKRGAGAPANSAGEQLIGAGANHEKLAPRYFGEVAHCLLYGGFQVTRRLAFGSDYILDSMSKRGARQRALCSVMVGRLRTFGIDIFSPLHSKISHPRKPTKSTDVHASLMHPCAFHVKPRLRKFWVRCDY